MKDADYFDFVVRNAIEDKVVPKTGYCPHAHPSVVRISKMTEASDPRHVANQFEHLINSIQESQCGVEAVALDVLRVQSNVPFCI